MDSLLSATPTLPGRVHCAHICPALWKTTWRSRKRSGVRAKTVRLPVGKPEVIKFGGSKEIAAFVQFARSGKVWEPDPKGLRLKKDQNSLPHFEAAALCHGGLYLLQIGNEPGIFVTMALLLGGAQNR
jgi:hypothetical protein